MTIKGETIQKGVPTPENPVEIENEVKISFPIMSTADLAELDNDILINYQDIIDEITKTIVKDKDMIILQRVIKYQDTEINKLNNVIDRMAKDIRQINKNLEDEGYYIEPFWLDIEGIKEYFMKEDK